MQLGFWKEYKCDKLFGRVFEGPSKRLEIKEAKFGKVNGSKRGRKVKKKEKKKGADGYLF